MNNELLLRIDEDLDSEDVAALKFLCRDHIPLKKLEAVQDARDLFLRLEDQGLLGDDDLIVKELLLTIRRFDLLRVLGTSPNQVQNLLQLSSHTTSGISSYRKMLYELSEDVTEDDLDSIKFLLNIPRGRLELCTVNTDIRDVPCTKDLTDVFRSLHFEVHLKEDLTASEILKVVKKFGQMDHSTRDAFVCCVLSHGEKGSVYGTDGQLVLIRDVTLPFTCSQCTSLAKKPKLFFIQACQGKAKQCGVSIQADGEGDEQEAEELYDTDARCVVPELASETIPDDSDFLLAMATVEDYKSFRSIKEGSIFIQELCRQLKTGCARNMDILTILTRVNRNVSIGVYLNSKQMPEPRYTLTKKLVLPLD
ncbi:caspase-8-like [Scleropages formosus]|uniref:Caspase-8 n=1 Tax=Scleropages formosus TaxID=113540 RepID=A0A0P7XKM1_SCLFO|nr:caspase-8-like [Scleropages formosus]